MTIGESLIKLRKNEKLSQEQLAENLGITRQTLSNYENDITTPDLETAKKICQVLNISLDELIDNRNTISSKISNTENLVKKQNKLIKIIFITLYFIILSFLIYITIYYLTKKDYTDKYQLEFACYKKNSDPISVNLESSLTTINENSERYIEEEVGSRFIINYAECNSDNCNDGKIFAGDNLSEAIDSVVKLKEALIEQGYTCH